MQVKDIKRSNRTDIKANYDESKSFIYRIKVSTGKSEKLVTEKGKIYQLKITKDYVYYNYNSSSGTCGKRISIKGGKSEKVVQDFEFDYVDNSSYIYSTLNGVHRYDFIKKSDIQIASGNFNYITSIGDVLYFSDGTLGYVSLYSYDIADNNWEILLEDKKIEGSIKCLKQVNGLLYFTAGTYDGMYSFFYGGLYYINKSGKTKEISKNLQEDNFQVVGKSICYLKDDLNYYKYNTTNAKSTKYTCVRTEDTQTFERDSKTYKVSLKNSSKVKVFSYTTGTEEKGIKTLADITYKQKKNYKYSSIVQEVGEYVLVGINEYNENWNLNSKKWFVLNTKGKVIASFK